MDIQQEDDKMSHKLVYGPGFTDPSRFYINVLLGNRSLYAKIKIADIGKPGAAQEILSQLGEDRYESDVMEMIENEKARS